MKIKNITYVDMNETRTDGRYPLRIGSEVSFFISLNIGVSMVLSYIKDNNGNPKKGVLVTSAVKDIEETDTEIVVKTKNSIYYLEK